MDFRLANETDIDKIGALNENAIVEMEKHL